MKVGDTHWSQALNVTKPSVTKLSIKLPDIALVYDLVMEVKQTDAYSRIVVIRPLLHFTNQTPRDLTFVLPQPDPRSPKRHSQHAPESFICRRKARVDSAICPPELVLRVGPAPGADPASADDYTTAVLPLSDSGLFTLKVEHRLRPLDYYALDVELIKFVPLLVFNLTKWLGMPVALLSP